MFHNICYTFFDVVKSHSQIQLKTTIFIYQKKEWEAKFLSKNILKIFAYWFTYYDIISDVTIFQYENEFEFEFIGVLRHMERYFSYICDGTDVQVDWRRSFTYGRAPNAIDISPGSLTCPSYTDTGPTFLYSDSDTPPL